MRKLAFTCGQNGFMSAIFYFAFRPPVGALRRSFFWTSVSFSLHAAQRPRTQ